MEILKPNISICIPTYNRTNYLARLLDSILSQTYKDFEIIITDDSPGNEVEILCNNYSSKLPIYYFKNFGQLGTPENWNESIRKAKGNWVKLMHDDDWFASKDSLKIFADYADGNDKFIFSAYFSCVVDSPRAKITKILLKPYWKYRVFSNPNVLFAKNYIGQPSVTMFHGSIAHLYDNGLKWRVDIEYYIRVLQEEKNFCYINQPLINIGINDSQVTNSCFLNPKIELPEGYIMLEKFGIKPLKNIWVYDAWWRLFRNMEIKTSDQLNKFVDKEWPFVIRNMLKDLSRIPNNFLEIGIFSKIFMCISYCRNFFVTEV